MSRIIGALSELLLTWLWASQWFSGKESTCQAGYVGLIPGLERSPGEANPLATHSTILAWRIPWTEECGGLQSIGLQRVGRDLARSSSIGTVMFLMQCTSNAYNKNFELDSSILQIELQDLQRLDNLQKPP